MAIRNLQDIEAIERANPDPFKTLGSTWELIRDGVPLTPVGKTFKPALNMLEIESVVREEADAAGVELAEVNVEQDPRAGIVARYRLQQPDTPQSARFLEALGRYTFKTQAL